MLTRSKLILAAMAATLAFAALPFSSCTRAPAEGRLQIMYSGNLRGNAAPCG
jgi:hypothetical protein